jgi:hypothetical protein
MGEATRKVLCDEHRCGWHGLQAEVLQTPNPFDPSDMLDGCPACKSINTIRYACDEPDCWREATCGSPTETGYRQTCGQHMPRRNEFG